MYTPGAPIWHQIPATNLARAKSFYAALFPWQFRPSDEEEPSSATNDNDEDRRTAHFTFGDAHYEKSQVSGGIQTLRLGEKIVADAYSSETGLIAPTVYYFVEDLEDVLGKVEGLGGKVLVGKTAQGGSGEHAVLRDTEGNAFGVYGVKG